MSDKPTSKRKTADRPGPDDLVNVRFALPETIVTATQQGVEINTCQGGKLFVPQSLLMPTEYRSAGGQIGNGSRHVVLQARVTRNIASLLRNLAAEIARLTHEVNQLQEKVAPKDPTS